MEPSDSDPPKFPDACGASKTYVKYINSLFKSFEFSNKK